jgi:hypothetical protein
MTAKCAQNLERFATGDLPIRLLILNDKRPSIKQNNTA